MQRYRGTQSDQFKFMAKTTDQHLRLLDLHRELAAVRLVDSAIPSRPC
jgi:hypothetical protein